jgi:hypothetical protein
MDLGDSPSSSPATPDVHDTSAPSPDQLISYLFTLGEVSQVRLTHHHWLSSPCHCD